MMSSRALKHLKRTGVIRRSQDISKKSQQSPIPGRKKKKERERNSNNLWTKIRIFCLRQNFKHFIQSVFEFNLFFSWFGIKVLKGAKLLRNVSFIHFYHLLF